MRITLAIAVALLGSAGAAFAADPTSAPESAQTENTKVVMMCEKLVDTGHRIASGQMKCRKVIVPVDPSEQKTAAAPTTPAPAQNPTAPSTPNGN